MLSRQVECRVFPVISWFPVTLHWTVPACQGCSGITAVKGVFFTCCCRRSSSSSSLLSNLLAVFANERLGYCLQALSRTFFPANQCTHVYAVSLHSCSALSWLSVHQCLLDCICSLLAANGETDEVHNIRISIQNQTDFLCYWIKRYLFSVSISAFCLLL